MARGAERNQKMRDDRREQILACALRLFAARGLAATKIADIAAEAAMSQGLLYHYFASKDEIFTELIRGAFEKMNSAARGLEALPMPPAEKLRLASVQLQKSVEESAEFAAMVLLIAQAGVSDATPPAAREILRQESAVPYGVIERLLREGQRDGSIKAHDAGQMSVLFWAAIKGLALHKAVYGAAYAPPDPWILTSLFLTEEPRGEGNA